MATGSLDGTAKVWPVPRRGKSVVFDRHRGVWASVAFSPDGRWLIRNAADEVTLWTAATQAKVATIPASGSAFSPDSKLLVCVGEASGEIWSLVGTEPKLVRTIPARIKLKLNEQPCWSPDGRLLAVRNQSNSITLWRTDEWIEVTKIGVAAAPRDNIQNYMFSPDGKLFTTSSARGDIRLWDAGDWSTWRLFPVPKQDYLSLAFSPDGRWLATGGRDTVIRLWDVATGNVRQLHGEAGSVWCLAFSHDGKTLAVGSHDGAVKFWNVATCREIMTLKAHDTIVCGLAFSPDDKTFATICVDQTMRLWTAPSLVEADTAASPDGHSRLP